MKRNLHFSATFVAPLGKVSSLTGQSRVVKLIVAKDWAHASRIANRMGLGVPLKVRLDLAFEKAIRDEPCTL